MVRASNTISNRFEAVCELALRIHMESKKPNFYMSKRGCLMKQHNRRSDVWTVAEAKVSVCTLKEPPVCGLMEPPKPAVIALQIV